RRGQESRHSVIFHLELGVDDVVVAAAAALALRALRVAAAARAAARVLAAAAAAALRLTRLSTLVALLAHLVQRLLQLLHRALDLVGIARRLRLRERVALLRDRLADVGRELVAVLLQVAIGLVHRRLGAILDLDELAPLLVVGAVLLGVAAHALDLVLGEAGA